MAVNSLNTLHIRHCYREELEWKSKAEESELCDRLMHIKNVTSFVVLWVQTEAAQVFYKRIT